MGAVAARDRGPRLNFTDAMFNAFIVECLDNGWSSYELRWLLDEPWKWRGELVCFVCRKIDARRGDRIGERLVGRR